MLTTVISLLRRHRTERPDAACLFSIDQDRGLTWSQLLGQVEELAGFFYENKIQANDRVAVVAENSLELATLYFAVMAYGATFCPLDPRAPELDRFLQRLKPKLVLRRIPDVKGKGPLPELPVSQASDHAAICFTSGTTDGAKAVAHTFESYQTLIAVPAVSDAASVGRDGRITSFIVRKGAIDAQGVLAHCSGALPADYLPDEIRFCDAIPRNARGKVDFEKLRREAKHADGSGGPVLVYYVPDRAADGKVRGVVVFVLDVEPQLGAAA